LIGIFQTEEEAYHAIEVVRDQPGFREMPEEFCVSYNTIGHIGWREGFVTIARGKGDPTNSDEAGSAKARSGED